MHVTLFFIRNLPVLLTGLFILRDFNYFKFSFVIITIEKNDVINYCTLYFLAWRVTKCLNQLFPLHLNMYAM